MHVKSQNHLDRLIGSTPPKNWSPLFLKRFHAFAEIGRVEDAELEVEVVFAQCFGVGVD